MTVPTIRLAEEADIPAIQALQLQWSEEEITHGFLPATFEEIQAALGPYYFVAELEYEVVGFVSGSIHVSTGLAILPEGQTYLELDDLYVAHPLRSQGIGHLLVEAVLSAARDHHVQAALVYSSTKDIRRVLHFYEQNGFQSWFIQMFRRL